MNCENRTKFSNKKNLKKFDFIVDNTRLSVYNIIKNKESEKIKMVVKIKRIVWVKNNGFEIKERELDCYFENDGSYKKSSGDWESHGKIAVSMYFNKEEKQNENF